MKIKRILYLYIFVAMCLLPSPTLNSKDRKSDRYGKSLRSQGLGFLTASVEPDGRLSELKTENSLAPKINLSYKTNITTPKSIPLAKPSSTKKIIQNASLSENPEASPSMALGENILEENPQPESGFPVLVEQDEPEEDLIEFQFENTDLENLVAHISELYQVTFITDDIVDPMGTGGKSIKGNKISFKTNKPLSKKAAWDLFVNFLQLAGLTIVPQADERFYRIQSVEAAQRSSIPSYIGVDHKTLPDNDQIIRYIYFVENSSLDALKSVVEMLKSSAAPLIVLQEMKAFVITDKAYNVKSLMKVVRELDRVAMPQSMSILKLRRTDAQQVKELYDSLVKTDDTAITSRLFPARKQPTSIYFPENTRVIAEPRTNTLILLGPLDAIKKIEEFIVKHVDVELDRPYSPLYVYQLKYADAVTVAQIMTSVTQLGKNTEAGKSGGVRGSDKFMKEINFTAEKETNRLIIRGDFEDYLKAKDIIEKLDEAQPQVAIEVLILGVTLRDEKELGMQIRNKEPGANGLVGNNVKFQTSGLFAGGSPKGVVENKTGNGVTRLLGDLITLVTGAPAGNTVLSLGVDQFGVWGIFQALKTITNLQILSNPFLTATNKTPAVVSVGETRRVVTGTVVGGGGTENSFSNEKAELEVKITPQVNSDGMIILDIHIKIDNFTDAADPNSANKTEREIITRTTVANKEVLALGGLIQNKILNEGSQTPLLGNIPVLGWFFKNKHKAQVKDNLLILISTRILEAEEDYELNQFTDERTKDYHNTLNSMEMASDRHDPIDRLFFAERKSGTEKVLDDFLFDRKRNKPKPTKTTSNRRMRRAEKKRKRKKQKTILAEQKRKKKKQQKKHKTIIAQKQNNTLAKGVIA